MTGQLFVFSAPSGAGKTSIINVLMERMESLAYSISHTTRPPRGGEKEGIDYYFVGDSQFVDMISSGELVEWASVYGCRYGTSAVKLRDLTAAGTDVVLDVDNVGAFNIKRMFHDSVLIFILPPSLEELERRLTARKTDTPGVIRGRMEKAARVIAQCPRYDYLIVNDDLEEAVDRAESIIKACRSKASRVAPLLGNRFDLDFSGATLDGRGPDGGGGRDD